MPQTLQPMDIKELIIMLERFIKSGRISFSLLTYDRLGEAVANELIVKYDQDMVLLYIKNQDGLVKAVGTETDLLFNEFLVKFLEVNETETLPAFDPKLFFQIKRDSSDFAGYSQENIDYFYNLIENQFASLTPALLHAKVDSADHDLIPFMGTKQVYYDLSNIINGQIIRNMDDTIAAIIEYVNTLRDNLTDALNNAKAIYDATISSLTTVNTRQDATLTAIKNDVAAMNTKLSTVTTSVTNMASKVSTRVRGQQFYVAGSGTVAYPVLIRYNSGINAITGGYEFFGCQFYLTYEDGNRFNVVMLGDGSGTNSSSYWTGIGTKYVVTQKCNGSGTPNIYNCEEIGPMQWILMLRGTSWYTVWTKYLDYLYLDASTAAKSGRNPINVPGTVANRGLYNNGSYNANFSKSFSNQMIVGGSIIVQNRFQLSIV